MVAIYAPKSLGSNIKFIIFLTKLPFDAEALISSAPAQLTELSQLFES